MNLAQALYEHLSNNIGIAAGRVYPVDGPEGAIGAEQDPCIIFQLVNQVDGVQKYGATSHWQSNVNLYCFASTFDVAWDLGDAVRAALHKFNGTMAGALEVLSAEMTARADMDIGIEGVYGQVLTVEILHA